MEQLTCRDCGCGYEAWCTYKPLGAATRRCRPCYNTSCRRRAAIKAGRDPDLTAPAGTKHGSGGWQKRPTHEDCQRCGESVPRNGHARIYYCSACRRIVENERQRLKRARKSGKPVGLPRGESKPKATEIRYWDCPCGKVFIRRSARKFCSTPCRDLAYSVKISARIMGLYRTAIAHLDIPAASMWHHYLCLYLAQRDGPRCHLCAKRVDLTLPSGPRGHDLGPSIDHLLPRSKGGTDELNNLALSHWACNRAKGNRGRDQQLRLIG